MPSLSPQMKILVNSHLKELQEDPPLNWKVLDQGNSVWHIWITIHVTGLLLRATALSGGFPLKLLSTFLRIILRFLLSHDLLNLKDFFIQTSVLNQGGYVTKFHRQITSSCRLKIALRD